MTGEDLEIKPSVVSNAKFQYYPLREAFNKTFKKDEKSKKVIKYDNDLVYNSVHNFNKYSLTNFDEIKSVDSKFDTINKFYNDLVSLIRLKVGVTKQGKIN